MITQAARCYKKTDAQELASDADERILHKIFFIYEFIQHLASTKTPTVDLLT